MKNTNYAFSWQRVPNVPTYVEYGAADIGVVGKDTILEENRMFTKCWTLASANAGCVSAVLLPPESC